jgi:hypothetical protein
VTAEVAIVSAGAAAGRPNTDPFRTSGGKTPLLLREACLMSTIYDLSIF